MSKFVGRSPPLLPFDASWNVRRLSGTFGEISKILQLFGVIVLCGQNVSCSFPLTAGSQFLNFFQKFQKHFAWSETKKSTDEADESARWPTKQKKMENRLWLICFLQIHFLWAKFVQLFGLKKIERGEPCKGLRRLFCFLKKMDSFFLKKWSSFRQRKQNTHHLRWTSSKMRKKRNQRRKTLCSEPNCNQFLPANYLQPISNNTVTHSPEKIQLFQIFFRQLFDCFFGTPKNKIVRSG